MHKTAPSDAALARAILSPALDLSYTLAALEQLAAEFSPSPAETDRWKNYLHANPCDLHAGTPSTIQ